MSDAILCLACAVGNHEAHIEHINPYFRCSNVVGDDGDEIFCCCDVDMREVVNA